ITIAVLLAAVLLSGIILIKLEQREKSKTETAELVPAALAAEGKPEHIRILVAYDDDRALRWRETESVMPQDRALRAEEVLRAVLAQYTQSPSPHPLSRSANIKEVFLAGDSTLLVNTNTAFADGHPSGIITEELTIASLIETIAANVPGIDRVKFLVDGKERGTLAGHLDLASFYDMKAVHEMAKEFE
ncbi:MAG TPA: GerMN domain-containing protein, partial [Terriglobales bacterium]|nr:GerMN domain-containing protein [Terriglobales bacterium]